MREMRPQKNKKNKKQFYVDLFPLKRQEVTCVLNTDYIRKNDVKSLDPCPACTAPEAVIRVRRKKGRNGRGGVATPPSMCRGT